MKKTKILKWLALMPVIMLSACSSNVSGEWDCPRQQGHGCIMIKDADKIALEKAEKHERKVWFAPYKDKSDKRQAASSYSKDTSKIDEEKIIIEKLSDADIVAKEPGTGQEE